MKYTLSILDAPNHFIQLTLVIENIRQDTIHLQLPSWRPGRYELQNYAKNIRNFKVVDQLQQPVPYVKTNKDRWEVNTQHCQTVIVEYEYYANQYDAGASYVCPEFLYVNPVNCFMYMEGRMDEPYSVTCNLPDEYEIACQLPVESHSLNANNYDLLADSPFIASPNLTHHTFSLHSSSTENNKQTTIHLWFQGKPYTQMDKMIAETKLYAEEQIALFGDIPMTDYHFLYHILPAPFRHGVEHLNSTVISMGPDTEWNNPDFYDSFMAISSHELFHLWNVKRIRPTSMLPYDFTKENYSTLGYVYEGVTTYYGDIILLRSGVWNWQQYTKSVGEDLGKHFTNQGRFNYSVAESSFDTWLDGYTPGIPARKVSIYTEGMLAAWIADILIIHHSNQQYSLDNVMSDLYHQFYKHQKGYDENDYRNLLEKYAGISFENYFNELILGKGHCEKWLQETLSFIGCSIDLAKNQLIELPSKTEAQKRCFNQWKQSRILLNQ